MAHRAWLAREVFAGRQNTAPYSYAALGGRSSARDVVWHADPVHLELARDHLLAMPVVPPPNTDEAAALLAAADEIVAKAGARFERVADKWFLLTPARWQLDSAPLETALQSGLHDALPAGKDAQMWSRLLNEIQMAWHAHPINAAREGRGETTINSLWLHGGEVWTRLPRLSYTVVASDAADVRGAAAAAEVPTIALDSPWPDGALVVWSDALSARSQHDWAAWQAAAQSLDSRLANHMDARPTDFVLTGLRSALTLHSRPSDRLKFWRARRLEEVLSE